jgi:hypothetical protein
MEHGESVEGEEGWDSCSRGGVETGRSSHFSKTLKRGVG